MDHRIETSSWEWSLLLHIKNVLEIGQYVILPQGLVFYDLRNQQRPTRTPLPSYTNADLDCSLYPSFSICVISNFFPSTLFRLSYSLEVGNLNRSQYRLIRVHKLFRAFPNGIVDHAFFVTVYCSENKFQIKL